MWFVPPKKPTLNGSCSSGHKKRMVQPTQDKDLAPGGGDSNR